MNASSNFTKISFPLPQPPWNHHKQREKDRGVATIFVPKDEFALRLTENSKYFRFYPREKVGNRAVSESSFFFSISIEWQTVEQRCLSARLRKRGRLFATYEEEEVSSHYLRSPPLSLGIFSPLCGCVSGNKREDSSSGTLSISFPFPKRLEQRSRVNFFEGSFRNRCNDPNLILWIFNGTRNYIKIYICIYISSSENGRRIARRTMSSGRALLRKWRRGKVIPRRCKYFHVFESS